MKRSCNLAPGVFCGAEIEPGTFHSMSENLPSPAGNDLTEPGAVPSFETASGPAGTAQTETAPVVRSGDDDLAHIDGRFGCLLN